MPREHKKRGRRAEQKKRKLDEAAAWVAATGERDQPEHNDANLNGLPAAKRPKSIADANHHLDISADFVSLGDVGDDELEEPPPQQHQFRESRQRSHRSKKHHHQHDRDGADHGVAADLPPELGPGAADPEAPANAAPFYGLLDEDEQEYFKHADSLLELNQFASADERSLLLENVYREASNKEFKLACSQSCSRLLERLILLSTPAQIKALFVKFQGHFLHLFQHRFASHCCEALFIKATPIVTQELTAPLEPPHVANLTITSDDKEGNDEQNVNSHEPATTEPLPSLESLFLSLVDELESSLGYLLTDRFASHPLRILLLILSGQPLPARDPSSSSTSKSAVQSKRKERITVAGGLPEDESNAHPRPVPDSFAPALSRLIAGALAGLTTRDLRSLATHPTGNPTLQVVLQAEIASFGKSRATASDSSLLRRLIPDDAALLLPPDSDPSASASTSDPSSETAAFVQGLAYDPVGSRLLETLVRLAPHKTFKALHRGFVRPRLAALARNDAAAYVAARALERLSRDDVLAAADALLPAVPALVRRHRTLVLRTLVERLRARDALATPQAARLADALRQAYKGPDGEFDVARLLMLGPEGAPPHAVGPSDGGAKDGGAAAASPGRGPANGSRPSSKAGLSAEGASPPEKTHGSLLAQALVAAPGALSDLVLGGVARLDAALLHAVARDGPGSRALGAALTAPHASVIFRRKTIQALYGSMGALALDPRGGSRVVAAVWEGTRGLAFIRERVAEELAENEASLKGSRVGRGVWRKWEMEGYKRERREWVKRSREKVGSAGFLPFPEGGMGGARMGEEEAVGERVKTPLERARERHALEKRRVEEEGRERGRGRKGAEKEKREKGHKVKGKGKEKAV
ncbi:armadillo-type protein [Lineolata rhizophorae]|uniref:Nucleolar protein 9 n=1 Tax=Lineolata rhizophorae TaxID=578093 RepID=A0A6A6P732_9PEZI|nr:armadillo-type protein [Lineolata rhizophorae]